MGSGIRWMCKRGRRGVGVGGEREWGDRGLDYVRL